MRQFINKYGAYIIVAALLISLPLYFYFGKKAKTQNIPPEHTQAYYVDEETGEESIHPASEIPPLSNKEGKPTLARALKISFDGGTTCRVVYLEKYTLDAQATLQSLPLDDPQRQSFNGLLIRLPQPGSPWVDESSKEGMAIHENLSKPEEGTPLICLPPEPTK